MATKTQKKPKALPVLDMTTAGGAAAYLGASVDLAEYNARCTEVQAANEKNPDWRSVAAEITSGRPYRDAKSGWEYR